MVACGGDGGLNSELVDGVKRRRVASTVEYSAGCWTGVGSLMAAVVAVCSNQVELPC